MLLLYMNGISNGAAILHFTSHDVNCNSFPKVPKVKWLPEKTFEKGKYAIFIYKFRILKFPLSTPVKFVISKNLTFILYVNFQKKTIVIT